MNLGHGYPGWRLLSQPYPGLFSFRPFRTLDRCGARQKWRLIAPFHRQLRVEIYSEDGQSLGIPPAKLKGFLPINITSIPESLCSLRLEFE